MTHLAEDNDTPIPFKERDLDISSYTPAKIIKIFKVSGCDNVNLGQVSKYYRKRSWARKAENRLKESSITTIDAVTLSNGKIHLLGYPISLSTNPAVEEALNKLTSKEKELLGIDISKLKDYI